MELAANMGGATGSSGSSGVDALIQKARAGGTAASLAVPLLLFVCIKMQGSSIACVINPRS